jgi:hypothetical protein
MAFKPNYNQERASRNRNKQQKKQEKLQRREEDAAKRKAARGDAVSDGAPEVGSRRSKISSLLENAHGQEKQQVANGFVLFDVLYEDGTQTSNRKVPAADLGGLDGDAPARTFIEMQDRKIGEGVGHAARAHQIDRPLEEARRLAPSQAGSQFKGTETMTFRQATGSGIAATQGLAVIADGLDCITRPRRSSRRRRRQCYGRPLARSWCHRDRSSS